MRIWPLFGHPPHVLHGRVCEQCNFSCAQKVFALNCARAARGRSGEGRHGMVRAQVRARKKVELLSHVLCARGRAFGPVGTLQWRCRGSRLHVPAVSGVCQVFRPPVTSYILRRVANAYFVYRRLFSPRTQLEPEREVLIHRSAIAPLALPLLCVLRHRGLAASPSSVRRVRTGIALTTSKWRHKHALCAVFPRKRHGKVARHKATFACSPKGHTRPTLSLHIQDSA